MSEIKSTLATLDEWEQQIGTAIRLLRLEAELDQLELAVRANVSRSAVQSLEHGKGSRLQTLAVSSVRRVFLFVCSGIWRRSSITANRIQYNSHGGFR